MVRYKDARARLRGPLAVAPAFSILLDPGEQVVPPRMVRSRCEGGCIEQSGFEDAPNTHWAGDPEKDEGALRVEVPETWRVDPAQKQLEFHQRGERQSADFTVHPGNRTEDESRSASLKSGHSKYDEGYSVVTREDLARLLLSARRTARQRRGREGSEDIKVGYVMAQAMRSDVLQQIGMNVTLIPARSCLGNLSRYQTIVLEFAHTTRKRM